MMPAGVRVLAAVSGGADSVALVHLLRDLEPLGCCQLVGVAHLNHGLRGRAADEDEAFCRDLAGRLDVPFQADRVELQALAARNRRSLEAEGHAVRHAFLERAARAVGADVVALGHTRDDQAETVVLRLIRGSGARGLAGMHPRTGIFVRPLLECSRAEVRGYVESRGIAFRDDSSNDDLAVPRNRVRHRVIPALLELSPGAVRAVARAAAISQADAELLDSLAARAAERCVREGPDHTVILDATALASEPLAVARRVVALVVQRHAGGRFVGFQHIDAVLRLARRPSGGRATLDLPRQCVERKGERLVVRHRSACAAASGTNSFRFSLSIPGEVESPDGWTLTAELGGPHEAPTSLLAVASPTCAVLDARSVRPPLVVRGWQAGDRIRPLGLGGTRKLQDVFVDRKVPKEARGAVPLVVDAEQRVVWVAGHVIAEDFRVTAATCDVVILKLKHWSNGQ